MDQRRTAARETLAALVREYKERIELFKDPHRFNEAQLRTGFVDPFFEALGWPVRSGQRLVGSQREVVVEDRAGRERPDYGFYVAGDLRFFVEAKQASKSIEFDAAAIFKLKSYVWNERAPLGLLFNFDTLLTFHGAFKPDLEQPDRGRVGALCLHHDEYVSKFDLLYDTFSREAVNGGSIDRLLAAELAVNIRQRGQIERDLFKARGARPVDVDFLESLTRWREEIAEEFARDNAFKNGRDLTEAVQRFLDRIVFARVAEDRGIERTQTLLSVIEAWRRAGRPHGLYRRLIELFRGLAPQFNGCLYAPHPLSDGLQFANESALERIVETLYYPTPYRFDSMPVEMLGAIYERFLGSVVKIDGAGLAVVEPKPEVRHAGGVYYTPKHIVRTIVARTIGPLLEGASPKQALNIRILDPACGSGSFLLGAYQFLIDWHIAHFSASPDRERRAKRVCFRDPDGNLRLTLQKKREILTSCLFGLDLDPQAVEVAQMSLYLKLLEGEAEESIAFQRSMEMFKAARYLPDLSANIRSGNALLEPRDVEELLPMSVEDRRRINAFDWKAPKTGFGAIVGRIGSRGGFDAIVGNPPYIRVQALTQWAPLEVELLKQRYATARTGNYDIYVVFIERCLSLLSTGGRVGLIIPTKWWQADYGTELRRLIGTNRAYAEVLDFAHEQVFDEPSTYTCISVFSQARTRGVRYSRVSPDVLKRGGPWAPPTYEHTVSWGSLGDETWHPGVPKRVRGVFDRLRKHGPSLQDVTQRVFQGLKTSLDSVFVLKFVASASGKPQLRSQILDRQVDLEPTFLKPLVKGGELKRYALKPPEWMLLFPYRAASLVGLDELKAVAPKTHEYLRENEAALRARERHRFDGPDWHQYGRTQALEAVASRKILTPDLAREMSFSLDEDGAMFFLGGASGGYGIIPRNEGDHGILLALLNSRLLEWILRPPGLSTPFRGGWFSCEARFINRLPIRFPKEARDRNRLEALAFRAVETHEELLRSRSDRDRSLLARTAEAVETEIDDFVYHLYGVTEGERRAIEEVVSMARHEEPGADHSA